MSAAPLVAAAAIVPTTSALRRGAATERRYWLASPHGQTQLQPPYVSYQDHDVVAVTVRAHHLV